MMLASLLSRSQPDRRASVKFGKCPIKSIPFMAAIAHSRRADAEKALAKFSQQPCDPLQDIS